MMNFEVFDQGSYFRLDLLDAVKIDLLELICEISFKIIDEEFATYCKLKLVKNV